MKLSKKELDILACAYFQADAPLGHIARECGYKEHTVRYCLENLLENGVIRRHAIVNPYKLGFTEFYLLFALSSQNSASKKRALKALQDSQEVSYLAEMGGEFQYGADLYARDHLELISFLDRISKDMGRTLMDKKISIVSGMTYFRPHYLSHRNYKIDSLTYHSGGPIAPIDETDHKILSGLMSSSYSHNTQLARDLGMPTSTLEYRMKALRRNGTLVGMSYLLTTPHSLGMAPFLLLVHLNHTSPTIRKRFFAFCSQHPHVDYLAYALGHADFEIGIHIDEPHGISDFVEDLNQHFRTFITKIHHFPVLRYFKFEFYPFRAFPGSHSR